jgi:REP element-mobilizing transposase RayT
MWNDTETPLAYLITFRCRGTWLHGDERGSVDRNNNQYGSPRIPTHRRWHAASTANLKHPPVNLDARMRRSVEESIKETCGFRNWALYAVNIGTNHAHSVVHAGAISPSKVLLALKANATRKMREDGVWAEDHSPWSDRGSKRYLWNESSVALAVDYVLYGQGDDLPDFD